MGNLYKKISRLCEKNKITIWKLEKECDFGHRTIARWETSSPSVANLKKVADYFKVSIDSLLKED